MLKLLSTLTILSASLFLTQAENPPVQTRPELFESLGRLNFKRPAYVSVIPTRPDSKVKNLYISSFGAATPEDVYYVQNFTGKLDTAKPVLTEKGKSGLVWPNEIRRAPANVFGEEGVVVSAGWFIPFKNKYGGLWYAPVGAEGKMETWKKIVSVKGFFYHRVSYMDVNGDGHLDIVSCRAHFPVMGKKQGLLVYLEPKNRADPFAEPWVEHVIGNHCDVYFEIADINNDGQNEIVVPEFFGSALTLISTSNTKGLFSNPSDIRYTTIDNMSGPMFEVQVIDVNNDGKLDILATTHIEKKVDPSGAVIVYEIPEDVSEPGWDYRVIANDFFVQDGFKEASPGGMVAFYPTDEKKGKPVIAVSGDGSQKAYLMIPQSQDPNNWEYDMVLLHDCKGTVGGIFVEDVDNDGYKELFVPCFNTDHVAGYRYLPNGKRN